MGESYGQDVNVYLLLNCSSCFVHWIAIKTKIH